MKPPRSLCSLPPEGAQPPRGGSSEAVTTRRTILKTGAAVARVMAGSGMA